MVPAGNGRGGGRSVLHRGNEEREEHQRDRKCQPHASGTLAPTTTPTTVAICQTTHSVAAAPR